MFHCRKSASHYRELLKLKELKIYYGLNKTINIKRRRNHKSLLNSNDQMKETELSNIYVTVRPK